MARKVNKPKSKRPAPSELDILQPYRTLPIGDREVTVRELGFFESLSLSPQVAALVGALVEKTGGADLDLALLYSVCAAQPEATVALLARACDQPIEWVRSLTASQGDLLVVTFWAVNADFFLQRVLSARAMQTPATSGPTSSAP